MIWIPSKAAVKLLGSGWGGSVLFIWFGLLVGTELVTEAIFQDDQYYQNHGWPPLVASLAAAMILWPLGRHLNGRGNKANVDTASAVDPDMSEKHIFLFIRMEYWALLAAAFGVWAFFRPL